MQGSKSQVKSSVWVLLPFLLLLIGCGKEKLYPKEYMLWVKDENNGLNKKKKIGVNTFRIQYKPTDFVILSELGINSKEYGNDKIEVKRKELEGMQYYDLYIASDAGDLIKSQSGSEQEYYNRLYYYSFSFANDIKLIEGDDTLNCDLFHFEKDYDLGKEKRFLLGFEKTNSNEDKTIYIDSKPLELAILKIKIKNSDIINVPLVQYETKN